MEMQHNYHRRYERNLYLENILKDIEDTLPPIVSRAEASRLTGGLISVKTLSNEDALRKGPKGRVHIGSKVGYTKMAFMEYLRRKLKR